MTKYYHISYRIELRNNNPLFSQELIDVTPIEYVLKWRNIGGHYGERTILFAQEITEDDYIKNVDKFNENL